MHYRAAGEVKTGKTAASCIQQPAYTPDHVGHRTVNRQRPQGEKDRHGAKLHTLGEGAGNQRRGDDGEHELVDHKCLFGNGGAVVRIGR